jgi:hypothetical protein
MIRVYSTFHCLLVLAVCCEVQYPTENSWSPIRVEGLSTFIERLSPPLLSPLLSVLGHWHKIGVM